MQAEKMRGDAARHAGAPATMRLTLHVWRQKNAQTAGKMVTYKVTGVSTHASFLEMLDILNEQLNAKGEEPVAFDHDCREGICGSCSMVINGRPHGGDAGRCGAGEGRAEPGARREIHQ